MKKFLFIVFLFTSSVANSVPENSDDQITLFIPAFEGPANLGQSVATILNLQIWQTLRKNSKEAIHSGSISPYGSGLIMWSHSPLPSLSHETAETKAKEFSVLSQFTFWGKVFEYGDGAIAQSFLTIPKYKDFREKNMELWRISISLPNETNMMFELDIPRRRYEFEPIILTNEVIEKYRFPSTLELRESPDTKVIGNVGNSFQALIQKPKQDLVKVRSKGKEGWIRIPQLSSNRSEVVDFVGGVIRIYRGDWHGAIELLTSVTNHNIATELKIDAFLFKAYALNKLGKNAGKTINEALNLNPYSRRSTSVAIMNRLNEIKRLHGNSLQKPTLLEKIKNLQQYILQVKYLYPQDDEWFSGLNLKLNKLETSLGL